MADYITITDSAIDPDAPLTSELAYAWRDNCVAIAEGAVGAPVTVQGWHGINQTAHGAGDASALIWSHAVDGNLTSIEIDPITAGYEYRVRFENLTPSGTSATSLLLEVDIAGTWNSNALASLPLRIDLGGGGAQTYRRTGEIMLPFLGAASTSFFSTIDGAGLVDGAVPPLINASAVGFSIQGGFTRDAAVTPLKFRLRASANAVASGKLWVYKRRIGGL